MSGARRVLLVEDDGLFRSLLAELLRLDGFEVRQAGDGLAALETLREWEPDVIVLDLGLPRMDGAAFQAHRRGMAGAAATPVLILSGNGALPEAAATLGGDAILAKPCDPDHLLATISCLAEAGPQRLQRRRSATTPPAAAAHPPPPQPSPSGSPRPEYGTPSSS